MWLCEPHFYEKDKKVPCCRRRIGLAVGETLSLIVHRVTRVFEEKNYLTCNRVSRTSRISWPAIASTAVTNSALVQPQIFITISQ
jgi:hypothetical protein